MRFPSILVMVLVWAGTLFSATVRYRVSLKDIFSPVTKTSSVSRAVYTAPANDTILLIPYDLTNFESRLQPKAIPTFYTRCSDGGEVIFGSFGFNGPTVYDQVMTDGYGCPPGTRYHDLGYVLHDDFTHIYVPPYNSPEITSVEANNRNGTLLYYINQHGTFYKLISTSMSSNGHLSSDIITDVPFSFKVKRLNGPASDSACSVPSTAECVQCAWPYMAVPDSSACGCRVSTGYYQSQSQLMAQCYAYCNSTSINGLQSVLDQKRSNFNVSNGSPVCACSEFTSQKTIYRPTSTCPVGTSPDISTPSDTGGLQKIEYDPGTIPDSVKNGSGGSTGKYDSSMNNHLRRIDSILGAGSGGSGSNPLGDSGSWSKYHDSLQYYGNGVDSVLSHDTGALRSKNLQALGDTSSNYNWMHSDGQSGNPNTTFNGLNVWNCPEYPDHEVYVNFNSIGINRIDTLRIGFQSRMQPYYPYIKILEQLLAVMAGFGVFMYIAAGSTGKDSV